MDIVVSKRCWGRIATHTLTERVNVCGEMTRADWSC